MNKVSDLLIENKELKERESALEQELQSLGMDFDVVVKYTKILEGIIQGIIRKNKDDVLREELEQTKAHQLDRYGNIAGLFKEEL